MCRRAAGLTQIGEGNSIGVSHISTTLVRMVFSSVCSTWSYSIELVTDLCWSCLLFLISDFCLYHSSPFSTVCFVTVGVVWWPGLLYLLCLHYNCAWNYFRIVPLLDSQIIPVLTCISVSHVFSSAEWLSVSRRQAFTILYSFTNELMGSWDVVGCAYTAIVGNVGGMPSHLRRSLLICCSSNRCAGLDDIDHKWPNKFDKEVVLEYTYRH